MRIVTFQQAGKAPQPGVVSDGQVFSLNPAGYADVLSFIAAGAQALNAARDAVAKGAGFALESVKLLAPIPRPGKLICVGLNYRDHAIESGMEIPKVPTIFNKFPACVIGPGDMIVLPKNSEKPDYEAEFAVVIGKPGRHIAAANWEDHVFGYTIVNDVSARDFQMATSQWLMGKTFDTFAPMGPWIVTKDEIGEPHRLDIKMTVGGEVRQNSNTRELIFGVPALIEYLSSAFTLEPGDVISTGTPAGVGLGFKPPKWLQAGEECVITIDGIGELRNPTVAEA